MPYRRVCAHKITRLKSALDAAPTDERLWSALGKSYDQNKDWIAAQEAYAQALEHGQDWPNAINNMGMSLLMQGRYEKALDKFAQAAQIAPSKALYDNNRRLTLVLMRQYDRALDDLETDDLETDDLETDDMAESRAAQLLNDAGYVAMMQGDRDRAKTLFEYAIARSATYHAKAYANLAALRASP